MTARTPEEVVEDFGAALRAGDADWATALLSREACFLTPDSTVIRGRARIHAYLRQLVEMVTDLTIDQRTMVKAGDVAVVSESWSMRVGRGADPVRRVSRPTIVLNRAEEVWRIAVVDPWRA